MLKRSSQLLSLCILLLLIPTLLVSKEPMYLKNNLAKTSKGDFIVTRRSKNYTLLHIYDIEGQKLRIEEITIPVKRYPRGKLHWRDWVAQGAPRNTSWLIYEMELDNGQIQKMYSVCRNSWCQLRAQDNFLATLINLRLSHIPDSKRKRTGPPLAPGKVDMRRPWAPRMVVDGQIIRGVLFDAWKTKWPNDGSELAGKTVEVYVPEENNKYPAYFPYWLEVSGMIGKAKVHIVDSGTHLKSPANFPGR